VNRKADFLQNESIRIDSHNESNWIDSNRELECSTSQCANADPDNNPSPMLKSWFLSPFPTGNAHSFNGPFPGLPRWAGTRKVNQSGFTETRDSEWQWHQLSHMQVCTSLQTDNHASTPSLSFLQARCPSCHPTNSVKALKAQQSTEGATGKGWLKLQEWTLTKDKKWHGHCRSGQWRSNRQWI